MNMFLVGNLSTIIVAAACFALGWITRGWFANKGWFCKKPQGTP